MRPVRRVLLALKAVREPSVRQVQPALKARPALKVLKARPVFKAPLVPQGLRDPKVTKVPPGLRDQQEPKDQ